MHPAGRRPSGTVRSFIETARGETLSATPEKMAIVIAKALILTTLTSKLLDPSS
jgi:hypothetical protein